MKSAPKTYQDGIFLVVEERSCPIYSAGDELKVEGFSLSVSDYKPGCLQLSNDLSEIVTSTEGFSNIPTIGRKKSRFNCGGCQGQISFEYKKEKDFATVQMKLLKETEERKKKKHLKKFFSVLRRLKIFDSLDDESLSELTVLLELKTIPIGKTVIGKDEPARHLYIILSGEVEIKEGGGARLGILTGDDIFGEMNLLSGEPVRNSVHTLANTQLALLSTKNFKHILKNFPILQLFMFKLFVDRAQAITLQSGNITSGMTGELSEIGVVDLLQLINSSMKTGVVEFSLGQGKAMVFFNEGEIIYTRFLKLRNKDALYALMGQKQGLFSYSKGIPEELCNLPPIGGFMGLMMEGVQNIDENE
jgi:CRP-like cAMP-binding protein